MTANLRDAKTRLSELIQLAANGEDIIITVKGEPKARLVPATKMHQSQNDRSAWIEELESNASAAKSGEIVETPQCAWEQLRSDRI